MQEIHQYRTLRALIKAVRDGEVPLDVLSPGEVAKILGVSRQAVYNRTNISRSLEAWIWKGVVFISKRSVEEALRKKRKVSDAQGELNVTT